MGNHNRVIPHACGGFVRLERKSYVCKSAPVDDNEPVTISALIRRYRGPEAQEALAERAGIGSSSIAAYETERRVPSADTVDHLADVFGLTAEQRAAMQEARLAAKRARAAAETPEVRLARIESKLDRLLGLMEAVAVRALPSSDRAGR